MVGIHPRGHVARECSQRRSFQRSQDARLLSLSITERLGFVSGFAFRVGLAAGCDRKFDLHEICLRELKRTAFGFLCMKLVVAMADPLNEPSKMAAKYSLGRKPGDQAPSRCSSLRSGRQKKH